MKAEQQDTDRKADPDSRPEAEAGGVLRFFRVPGADGVGQDRAAARSEHGGKRHDDAEHRHDDGDSRYLGGIPQLGDEKEVGHVVEDHDHDGQQAGQRQRKDRTPDRAVPKQRLISALFCVHGPPPFLI